MYFECVFICQCINSVCVIGALAQQSLGQVRLKDLPEWLVCKTPGHPRDLANMVQKGKQPHKTHTNINVCIDKLLTVIRHFGEMRVR